MLELDINQEPASLAECERLRLYYQMLLKSYTAKVERIEPESLEFEETMNAIFKAQDAIKAIGLKCNTLRSKESIEDIKSRSAETETQ